MRITRRPVRAAVTPVAILALCAIAAGDLRAQEKTQITVQPPSSGKSSTG